MIRYIKILLAVIGSKLFTSGISSNNIRKKLLIMRIDEIGDYILFRNFIKEIRIDENYKNSEITLLGNNVWKDMAEFFDAEYIDKFIWLDKSRFLNDTSYMLKKTREILSVKYNFLISPVYNRNKLIDLIALIVRAEKKVASEGNFPANIYLKTKLRNKIYNKLIPEKKDIIFEFYRNREFAENFLGRIINICKPEMNIKDHEINWGIDTEYALLFIGGRAEFRKWDIENYVIITDHIKSKYGYDTVICGGPDDMPNAQEFTKRYKNNYYNLTGKTSLPDLAVLLKNANLVVSNESCAAHICVAIGQEKMVVISNGNHFGRFNPYPEEITGNYYIVYPHEFTQNLRKTELLKERFGNTSPMDINLIKSDDVIEVIDKIMV